MNTFLRFLTIDDVNSHDTLLDYAQQTLGLAVPQKGTKQRIRFQAAVNDFFRDNPQASWVTLAKTVDFMRSRKFRVSQAWYIPTAVGAAYRAGYLAELDPLAYRDPELEEDISKALLTESDEGWRRRLICSEGVRARRQVLVAWTQGKRDPLDVR
jgi:hypothetical protein